MKGTFTSLLTLVIMVIGLAVIIGGTGAIRTLFAPVLEGIKRLVQRIFFVLIVIVVVTAWFYSKISMH
jgi:hypothetical protein